MKLSPVSVSRSMSVKDPLDLQSLGNDAQNHKSRQQVDLLSTKNLSARDKLLASWGVLGVMLMLGNAIKRLMPIALQPFYSSDFTTMQWVMYIAWGLFMSYAEGYKGFHQKFSPLVVKRAFTLKDNGSFLNVVFAWAYSMGLFFATRKRMIISWSITVGVMGLVVLVKNLAHPWRSIMDGGVVAGLTIGSVSMFYHYVRAMRGRLPDIDACMDSTTASESKRCV